MTARANPKRGELWWVDLEPTQGAEITKARPCLVVSADSIGRLPLRIIVPITGWDDRYRGYSWMIPLQPDQKNGLAKPSTADAFQVRAVALQRFLKPQGVLRADQIDQIAAAIALCVDAP